MKLSAKSGLLALAMFGINPGCDTEGASSIPQCDTTAVSAADRESLNSSIINTVNNIFAVTNKIKQVTGDHLDPQQYQITSGSKLDGSLSSKAKNGIFDGESGTFTSCAGDLDGATCEIGEVTNQNGNELYLEGIMQEVFFRGRYRPPTSSFGVNNAFVDIKADGTCRIFDESGGLELCDAATPDRVSLCAENFEAVRWRILELLGKF